MALLLGSTSILQAQGTALVPLTDPVYRDLDRLVELGLADSLIVGQRPYSYRELCRATRAARVAAAARSRDDDERRLATGLLSRLEQRCAADAAPTSLTSALAEDVSATLTSTDYQRRTLPGVFGRPTEATIGDLAQRRLGRSLSPTQSLVLEAAQRLEATSWLAFNARERLEVGAPHGGHGREASTELLLGGVRARFGNTAIMVGREQLAWAQDAGDGLFLASDAPALDQISIASDQPFRMPGILGRLGPTQGTLVLADLGPSISRSHSELLAYKVSVQPTPAVELGGTVFNHFGGEGGRKSGLLDRVVDFVPFIDIFRRHNYTDTTRTLDVESDKALGLDGRVRIDRLGGVTLAGEWLIDDFDVHKLPALLTGLGSHTLAVIVPRLGTPALSLTLSAKHMGILTYTHNSLQNGMTTRGRLLGDELGPNAKAFGARLGWTPSATYRLDVEARSAIYSNADYGATYTDPALTHYAILKTSHTADELRDRLGVALLVYPGERISLLTRGTAQRTRNFDFGGGRRNDYLLDLSLQVRP
jgi:hypothetical protein